MSAGETPRTDANIKRMGVLECVPVAFARTLERELAAANESARNRLALWESTESALTTERATVARLREVAQATADANHAATADAKAEDIAAYFIDTILKAEWDRDHMTRILEGWLAKHRNTPPSPTPGSRS